MLLEHLGVSFQVDMNQRWNRKLVPPTMGRSRALVYELVELDLCVRPLQSTSMAHDFPMGVAVPICIDVSLGFPFRVRDEFVSILAAQKLFRNATLLLNHQRSTFRFPDLHGFVGFGRI